MNYKVVITTKTGDKIVADDSVVSRQGTVAYNQICNEEDILVKDSTGHVMFVPHRNVVKAEVTTFPSSNPSADISKPVRFIDYDGTIPYSYTLEEFAELNELPANPSHDGLVAQGWNWSLEDAKEYLEKYPEADMTIGQMYVTESGDTEIDIELVSPERLSPYLGICIDGAVTIDWGDDNTDVVTGEDLTTPINTKHDYETIGNYTIKIHVDSGSIVLGGFEYDPCINDNSDSNSRVSQVYSSSVKQLRVGNNTLLGGYAFDSCYNLERVTLPIGIDSIPDECFDMCCYLKHLVIPIGVTSIGESAMYYCFKLDLVSLPTGLKSVDSYAIYYSGVRSITVPESIETLANEDFGYNMKIEKAVIPDTITVLSGAFSECENLRTYIFPDTITALDDQAFCDIYIKSITIPESVTSIGKAVFKNSRALVNIENFPDSITEIPDNTFNGCYSLPSFDIPDSVTVIGQYAFSYCTQLKEIEIPESVTQIKSYAFSMCLNLKSVHLKRTTPPSLAKSNIFQSDPEDLVIYVPYSEDHSILTAYQSATNWSAYASKMQEEEAE